MVHREIVKSLNVVRSGELLRDCLAVETGDWEADDVAVGLDAGDDERVIGRRLVDPCLLADDGVLRQRFELEVGDEANLDVLGAQVFVEA